MRQTSAFLVSLSVLVLFAQGFVVQPARAVMPSDQLFPETAKGYVSIPDFYRLEADFAKTQIGQLLADPVMKPFSQDLTRQLQEKWSKAYEPLGLSWKDMQGVPGGEVALARMQPAKDQAALALIIDVTGKQAEVDELLQKVDRKMVGRNATKDNRVVAGTSVTVYTETSVKNKGRQAVFFIHPTHLQLVASDNLAIAQAILGRFAGKAVDNLAGVKAYQVAMQRTLKEQGDQQAHVRWFVEPFGFVEASRTANPNYRPKKGTDLLAVLRNQGFAAVQGIGGLVTLSDGKHDVLHRTMVYAPGVEREAGDPNQDKYDLAMRMLNFPNLAGLKHQPPVWIPRNLAAFISVNADLKNAFEYSKTLVNALADDEIFEDVIESLLKDPSGPQIDVRKDVVANLAQHFMVLSNYQLPITPNSERLLIAIELKDTEPVRRAVNKTMENDPNAVKKVIGDVIVWEIVEEEIDEPELNIDLGFEDFDDEDEKEEKQSLPTSAVAVARGHLIISSHREFIEEVLSEADRRETLAGSIDFQSVQDALQALGATAACVQTFSRTDEEFRGTYELLRQGKMPEAKSLTGKILNGMLDEDGEDEKLRDQELDGSKLPEYQMVRRYLGPAGVFVVSKDDGWLATGCFLSKETLQVVLKLKTE